MDTSPSLSGLSAARLLARTLPALLLFVLARGAAPVQAAGTEPLAIKGYDVVAYFTLGKAVPGRPEFEYEWDEQRYRFVNDRHMAMFKADPGRYAPRFGNICASALAFGLAWEANPENWDIYEGRLYVFGTAGARDVFVKDPRGVIAAAGRNADRLHKGQHPLPEFPLPPDIKAGFTRALEQCRQDAAPAFCQSKELADVRRILESQPPVNQ